MVLVWILLLLGFILLIKGADYFVEGSSSVAKALRIPGVVIGLTVVAMGTSAPELAVSVTAALTGNNDIAVGNVIGSNIFNLMVVAGVCGIILPMAVDPGILNKDFIFCIVISGVLLAVMAFDLRISRADGLLLIGLFVYFIVKTVKKALKDRTEVQEGTKPLSPVKSLLYIAGGIGAVILGGDLVVDSASRIAVSFGLSQNLIALTIVAVGTSLPELVTSVVASRKGENGLALGNVIGSNIFNMLMILGLSSVIHPILITTQSVYDLMVLIVFSAVVWFVARSQKEISRGEGMAILAMYIGYMVYIILR